MIVLRSPAQILFAAGLAVLATSCGGSGPALHPVTGDVLVDGQPAEGATVTLQPVGGSAHGTPSGVVTEDGSFTLSTFPHGDGAPAGQYAVVITWYPEGGRSLGNPQNVIPPEYADATTTPLPNVTVAEGDNELPAFELKSD